MLLLLILVLMVLYQGRAGQVPPGEVWFVMGFFVAGGYIAGFLDSRLFARLDKNNANILAEAEARYEQNFDPQPPVATTD